MMLPRTLRNLLFLGGLFAIEAANTAHLNNYVNFHFDPMTSLIEAGAFAVLLWVITMMLAQQQAGSSRALLLIAGLMLFALQALANCVLAFDHGYTRLPAEKIAQLFGGDPGEWKRASAILYGAGLNVIGFLIWWSMGRHLHSEAAPDSTRDADHLFRTLVDH